MSAPNSPTHKIDAKMTTETSQPNNHQPTGLFLRNVILKSLLLFILLNAALGLIQPGGDVGRLSVYNVLIPGRVRLPFGENPDQAYNLSLYDLEAMLASHEINAGPKPQNEFRIILIGDSATWGTLLKPEDTLSGKINAAKLATREGQQVHAYNLAYPTLSLTKDLMILEAALRYDPDLVIWPVTLQSFPNKVQINTPLVANNPQRAKPLMEQFDLGLEEHYSDFEETTFWDRTLIGRRRALLDAIQLQFYGVLWAATGIDQTYPADYTPAQRDFEAGADQFQGWGPPNLPVNLIAPEVLKAGADLAGDVPVLVVNEPILVSQGQNSEVRYNHFYPRWAYDQYRLLMAERSVYASWKYVDLWDFVPPEAFTNSAVHLTPEGMAVYFNALLPTIQKICCQ